MLRLRSSTAQISALRHSFRPQFRASYRLQSSSIISNNPPNAKSGDQKSQQGDNATSTFAERLQSGPAFADFVNAGDSKPLSVEEALELRPTRVDGRPRKQ